jgi:hypothetical protein
MSLLSSMSLLSPLFLLSPLLTLSLLYLLSPLFLLSPLLPPSLTNFNFTNLKQNCQTGAGCSISKQDYFLDFYIVVTKGEAI